MDQMSGKPVLHRVYVPIGGVTVAEMRARAAELGLDPKSRMHIQLLGIEQVETDWRAEVTFEVGAAGIVPVGVGLHSTRGQPVTRAAWDRVRIAEIIGEAAEMVSWLGPISRHPEQAEPFEVGVQNRGRGKGRPSQYSDDHYRRVGQVYSVALEQGKPPVRAVARAFEGTDNRFAGLTSPTDKRARAWVREARARGYIKETVRPNRSEQGKTKGGDQS